MLRASDCACLLERPRTRTAARTTSSVAQVTLPASERLMADRTQNHESAAVAQVRQPCLRPSLTGAEQSQQAPCDGAR